MAVPAIAKAEGLGVNVSPATVYILPEEMPDGLEREMVLLPMFNTPFWPRQMTVPLIVTAGPSAEMVVPATEKAEGFGVNVWPATVNASAAKEVSDGVVREIVLPSMAKNPDGSRLIAVPPTVTAGPPAETILPAIEKAEGFGVKVWPATANTVVEDGLARETVLPPMAKIPY